VGAERAACAARMFLNRRLSTTICWARARRGGGDEAQMMWRRSRREGDDHPDRPDGVGVGTRKRAEQHECRAGESGSHRFSLTGSAQLEDLLRKLQQFLDYARIADQEITHQL
jgi:hypothetical protein